MHVYKCKKCGGLMNILILQKKPPVLQLKCVDCGRTIEKEDLVIVDETA